MKVSEVAKALLIANAISPVLLFFQSSTIDYYEQLTVTVQAHSKNDLIMNKTALQRTADINNTVSQKSGIWYETDGCWTNAKTALSNTVRIIKIGSDYQETASWYHKTFMQSLVKGFSSFVKIHVDQKHSAAKRLNFRNEIVLLSSPKWFFWLLWLGLKQK